MSYIRVTKAALDIENKIVEKWRESSHIKWNRKIKNHIYIGNEKSTKKDLWSIVEKNGIKYTKN